MSSSLETRKLEAVVSAALSRNVSNPGSKPQSRAGQLAASSSRSMGSSQDSLHTAPTGIDTPPNIRHEDIPMRTSAATDEWCLKQLEPLKAYINGRIKVQEGSQ